MTLGSSTAAKNLNLRHRGIPGTIIFGTLAIAGIIIHAWMLHELLYIGIYYKKYPLYAWLFWGFNLLAPCALLLQVFVSRINDTLRMIMAGSLVFLSLLDDSLLIWRGVHWKLIVTTVFTFLSGSLLFIPPTTSLAKYLLPVYQEQLAISAVWENVRRMSVQAMQAAAPETTMRKPSISGGGMQQPPTLSTANTQIRARQFSNSFAGGAPLPPMPVLSTVGQQQFPEKRLFENTNQQPQQPYLPTQATYPSNDGSLNNRFGFAR